MVREEPIRLRDIGESNLEWKITARIMHMWIDDYPDPNKNYVNLILCDVHGDRIIAKFKPNDIRDFQEILIQGKIFDFTKFKSSTVQYSYWYTTNDYQIFLQTYTNIKMIEEEDPSFPKGSFDFGDFSEVPYYAQKKKDQCIDLLGRLHYHKESQPRTVVQKNGDIRNTHLRDVYLMNEREELIRITLWGDLISAIDEAVQSQKEGHTSIVIVTSLLCDIFEGTYYAKSTGATKVILNDYEYSEVQEFAKDIEKLDVPNTGNRKSIRELLDMVKGEKSKMDEYWVTATILHVNHNAEWHYMACGKCNKNTQFLDGSYSCRTCKNVQPSERPTERYKLSMDIQDESRMMMVTGFDEAITNLFDVSVQDMIATASQENGNKAFEKICKNLVGKKTSFYVHITNYNWATKNTSSMTVKKIEDIPDLKPTIKKIINESKVNLAPDTPMKNSRKAIVINVDEEKGEISYKKFKYIKKEPLED